MNFNIIYVKNVSFHPVLILRLFSDAVSAAYIIQPVIMNGDEMTMVRGRDMLGRGRRLFQRITRNSSGD
jgi:hypothetical protein